MRLGIRPRGSPLPQADERSTGWLMHHRRLTRGYKIHPHRSEAMIRLAMTDLMTRDLAVEATFT